MSAFAPDRRVLHLAVKRGMARVLLEEHRITAEQYARLRLSPPQSVPNRDA